MAYTLYDPNDYSRTVNGRNVSRIEFESFGGDYRGFFLQFDGQRWLEQDRTMKVRFSFVESERGLYGLNLTDSPRKVELVLDTGGGQILYRSSSKLNEPEDNFQKLYKLVGMSSGQPKSLSLCAKQINEWCASGGPVRVGLPTNALQPLNELLLDYRYRTAHIFHDIAKIEYFWNRIEAVREQGVILPLLEGLAAHLGQMQERCDVLVDLATRCRIQVNRAGGVDEVLRTRTAQLDQGRVAEARKRRPHDLARAIAWNREFWERVSIRAVQINDNDILLLRELDDAEAALEHVVELNSVLTEYQNTLSRAEHALGNAVRSADNAQLTASDHLGRYYSQKAGKEILALVGWIDTLPSIT